MKVTVERLFYKLELEVSWKMKEMMNLRKLQVSGWIEAIILEDENKCNKSRFGILMH